MHLEDHELENCDCAEHEHDHHHDHDHEHIHTHTHTHDGSTHTHSHSHEHSHEGHEDHDHEHTLDELHDSDKDMRILEKLLVHWVEHNTSHAEGFEEWAQKAIANNRNEVADAIYNAIGYINKANEELAKASELL